MMIFISGAIVLLGGLTALLLNIAEGCGSLASTLLFLVTVAGGILLGYLLVRAYRKNRMTETMAE